MKTTEEAVKFVTDVANPNGGLILDIWHAQRGGTPYESLPGLVPQEYLVGVELDDGFAEPNGAGLPNASRYSRSPKSWPLPVQAR